MGHITEIENAAQLYSLLYRAGMTKEGIAGAMACICRESGYDPQALERPADGIMEKSRQQYTDWLDSLVDPYEQGWKVTSQKLYDSKKYDWGWPYNIDPTSGGGFGYGICQWTYFTFHIELSQFAKQYNMSHGSLALQVKYLTEKYMKERIFRPQDNARGLFTQAQWDYARGKSTWEILTTPSDLIDQYAALDIFLIACELNATPEYEGTIRKNRIYSLENYIWPEIQSIDPMSIDVNVDYLEGANGITNKDVVKRALQLYNISYETSIHNPNTNTDRSIKSNFNLNNESRWSAAFVSEVFDTIEVPSGFEFNKASYDGDLDADYIYTNDVTAMSNFFTRKGNSFKAEDIVQSINYTQTTQPPDTNQLHVRAGDIVFFGGDAEAVARQADISKAPPNPPEHNVMWAWDNNEDSIKFRQNQCTIIQFFMNKGLSKAVSVGLSAAMHYENYCNPGPVKELNRFGICAWLESNEEISNYLASHGTGDKYDINQQLEFLWQALHSSTYTTDTNYGPLLPQLYALSENTTKYGYGDCGIFKDPVYGTIQDRVLSTPPLSENPSSAVGDDTPGNNGDSVRVEGITDSEACFLAAYRFTRHYERPGSERGPMDRGHLAMTYEWPVWRDVNFSVSACREVGIVVAVDYKNNKFVSLLGDQFENNQDNASKKDRTGSKVRLYPVNPQDAEDATFNDIVKKYLQDDDYNAFISKLSSSIPKSEWINIDASDVQRFASTKSINDEFGVIDPLLLANISFLDSTNVRKGQRAIGYSNVDCIKIKATSNETSEVKDIVRVVQVDEDGSINIISRRLSEIETSDGNLNCYSGPISSTEPFTYKMKDFIRLKVSNLMLSKNVPIVTGHTQNNKIRWQLGISSNKKLYFIYDKDQTLNFRGISDGNEFKIQNLVDNHKAMAWGKSNLSCVVSGHNLDGNVYKYEDVYSEIDGNIRLFGGANDMFITAEGTPLNIASGVSQGSFTKNGNTINYWIRVPNNVRTYMPLIVFFHGSDECMNTSAVRSKGLIGLESSIGSDILDKYIILQPVCPTRAWSADSTVYNNYVKPLIDDIVTKFSINTNGIVLTGHSLGSCACWYYGDIDGDKYCAISPVSHDNPQYVNGVWTGGHKELTGESFWRTTPVWAFGSDDATDRIGGMRADVRWINETAGGNAQFTQVSGPHYLTPTQVYSEKKNEWFSWIDSCIKPMRVVQPPSESTVEAREMRQEILGNSQYWHDVELMRSNSSTDSKLILNARIDGINYGFEEGQYIDITSLEEKDISITLGHAFQINTHSDGTLKNYEPTSLFRNEFIFHCSTDEVSGEYLASIDFKQNCRGDGELQVVSDI